jgi:hypothetical protein
VSATSFEILCSGVPVFAWSVSSVEPPRILRHCPRCAVDRPFACAFRFRVNANKRRLDVWLLYRCVRCEETWKLPLHERVSPGSIADRLDAYHDNDEILAAAIARDPQRLRGLRREPGEVRVEAACAAPCVVALSVEPGLDVALGEVLARGLGASRSEVTRRVDRGSIVIPDPRDLRRPARDGARAWVGS